MYNFILSKLNLLKNKSIYLLKTVKNYCMSNKKTLTYNNYKILKLLFPLYNISKKRDVV